MQPTKPVQSFHSKYKKQQGGCWLWTASAKSRYGAIALGNGKRTSAHRFSYELYFGVIPEGLNVCHRCDVPKCVNPKHLFLGTARENVNDCIKKARFILPPVPFGKKYRAKLNVETANKIRVLYSKNETSYRKLASMFGVSAVTIGNVIRNEFWS
jgi:hypothetical protein